MFSGIYCIWYTAKLYFIYSNKKAITFLVAVGIPPPATGQTHLNPSSHPSIPVSGVLLYFIPNRLKNDCFLSTFSIYSQKFY